jgi:hypothetical protein
MEEATSLRLYAVSHATSILPAVSHALEPKTHPNDMAANTRAFGSLLCST